MNAEPETHCIAFEGSKRIASGVIAEVARKAKQVSDRKKHESVLIFDDGTSELIEVDFRGSLSDVLKRLEKPQPVTIQAIDGPDRESARGPGRPRLGVVAREVTL